MNGFECNIRIGYVALDWVMGGPKSNLVCFWFSVLPKMGVFGQISTSKPVQKSGKHLKFNLSPVRGPLGL